MPSAERIENSYRFADGVTGGYASESWLVKGVDNTRALSGEVTQLPKVNDPHPLAPGLIVRERIIETIIDKQTTLVRVDYRPASFDIGTLYSTSSEFAKEVRLRLLWTEDNIAGSRGLTLRGGKDEPQFDFVLFPTTRKFTVRAGGDINDVMNRIIRNKNHYYTSLEIPIGPNDPPYLFVDGNVRQLKNGQVIAEYTFWTHYGLRGPAANGSFPLGTYPNQAFAIPFVPPMASIYTTKDMVESGFPYLVKSVQELYPRGKELTGL